MVNNAKPCETYSPNSRGLNVLFVAKTPAPQSVRKGHYFQGAHGRSFWRILKQYGILKPSTEFEDDSLLQHRYGLTAIAKIPRPFGHEPSPEEYRAGAQRIRQLITMHGPKVVVFVYKRVLDALIQLEFGISKKSTYGFNRDLEEYFGCSVFVFPLPGTPYTKTR
jgi:uracil-DNA glycosylase